MKWTVTSNHYTVYKIIHKGLAQIQDRQMVCNVMMQNKILISAFTIQLTFKQLHLGLIWCKDYPQYLERLHSSLSICYVRLDFVCFVTCQTLFICPNKPDSKHLQLCRPLLQLLNSATILQRLPQAICKKTG